MFFSGPVICDYLWFCSISYVTNCVVNNVMDSLNLQMSQARNATLLTTEVTIHKQTFLPVSHVYSQEGLDISGYISKQA